jgi:hypothetical protein
LVAAIIAAGLYGNIGIKVLYVHVLQELFGFPTLVSKSGKYIWVVAVIVYWSIAFVVSIINHRSISRLELPIRLQAQYLNSATSQVS